MGGRKDRRRGSAQGGEGMSGFLLVIAVASLGIFFAYLSEKARRRAVLRELRKRYGSRVRAADRLRVVIAADRAAVPCGRWVPVRDACVAVDRWQYQNYMRRAFGLKELPPLPSREVLPRYRWSERR